MNRLELINTRAQKERDGCLTVDAAGNEILIGLTREETEWLLRASELDDGEEGQRFLDLYDRHEKARLNALRSAQPEQ